MLKLILNLNFMAFFIFNFFGALKLFTDFPLFVGFGVFTRMGFACRFFALRTQSYLPILLILNSWKSIPILGKHKIPRQHFLDSFTSYQVYLIVIRLVFVIYYYKILIFSVSFVCCNVK